MATAMMTSIFVGAIGAAIGSFLNVCICRWPEGESVIAPSSHCPGCGSGIGWRDNVPILGFALLRGRCRHCRARISAQYPLVEIAASAIWIAGFLRYGPTLEAFGVAVFLTLLLGIAITDARTYLIPHGFSLGGLAFGLLFSLAPGRLAFIEAAAGAALGFTVLYLTAMAGEWWLGKPAMGGGDIRMMAMVGAFLGPAGALITIFFGALAALVVFLPISLRTGRLIPFGTFLAIGAAVVEVWGGAIAQWYRISVLGY